MEKKDVPPTTHTATTEKPVSEVEFYRNRSTLTLTDIISLKARAPTPQEASALFTEKFKELRLQEE